LRTAQNVDFHNTDKLFNSLSMRTGHTGMLPLTTDTSILNWALILQA